MQSPESQSSGISRRGFLRQTFAFSALAGLSSHAAIAESPHAESGSHEILLIGDWGYEDVTGQAKVASGMVAYARRQNFKPEAFLLLGDNWYGALQGGVHSTRWLTNFESMYPAEVFNCPAYAVLGNHDYQYFPESKVDAELAYAHSRDTRWTMPARWYRFEFPQHDPLISFIALDSNMPNPKGPQADGRNFTLTEAQRIEQLGWFESELAKPRKTPYLAVIAHHPVYSNGPHGDHATLVRDWDPLFRKYGVSLYMAGHDHDLQHLEFEKHPTSHFLSGGGGADLYPLKIDQAKRGPYAAPIYGFSHLSVTPQRLTLRHLDSDGRLLHSFMKYPNGRVDLSDKAP